MFESGKKNVLFFPCFFFFCLVAGFQSHCLLSCFKHTICLILNFSNLLLTWKVQFVQTQLGLFEVQF